MNKNAQKNAELKKKEKKKEKEKEKEESELQESAAFGDPKETEDLSTVLDSSALPSIKALKQATSESEASVVSGKGSAADDQV